MLSTKYVSGIYQGENEIKTAALVELTFWRGDYNQTFILPFCFALPMSKVPVYSKPLGCTPKALSAKSLPSFHHYKEQERSIILYSNPNRLRDLFSQISNLPSWLWASSFKNHEHWTVLALNSLPTLLIDDIIIILLFRPSALGSIFFSLLDKFKSQLMCFSSIPHLQISILTLIITLWSFTASWFENTSLLQAIYDNIHSTSVIYTLHNHGNLTSHTVFLSQGFTHIFTPIPHKVTHFPPFIRNFKLKFLLIHSTHRLFSSYLCFP